ncbi:MAG: hypothetical protein ACMG51_01495 [Ginsengibacter sp.]
MAFILSSCFSPRYKVGGVGRTADKPTPHAHLWAYLHAYGGEEDGYSTYTYVLTGRDPSHKVVQARYNALINAIQSSTAESNELSGVVPKGLYNLFLIPVHMDKDPYIPIPSNKFSIKLVTILTEALPGQFENPGPFLVTLTKPIRSGREQEIADILYFDLSEIHPKAMREVVREYKKRVVARKSDGKEKLEHLHLRLAVLSKLLNAEDYLRLARISFLELQNASAASD